MLALSSRGTPGGGSDGNGISLTIRFLQIVVVATAASLFIVTAVRNLRHEQYSDWKLKFQNEHGSVPGNDSASTYEYIQPGQPFVVTGARTGFLDTSTWRPPRLEITEFERSGPAFDLYLQCQNELMARDQEDVLSYYKIAGIHGKPYEPWNGIHHSEGVEAGYAPHGSILFPVWHRPYVAMFEQLICDCAVSLAAKYPATVRELYYQEALTLRLPYWDWARNSSLPVIVNHPTYLARTPKGIEKISNPLFRYVFHPVPGTASSSDEAFKVGKFTRLPYTVRSIDDNGVIDIDKTNELLRTEGDFVRLTQILLTKLNGSFAHFADRYVAEASDAETTINIENIHNHVHELIAGHMGSKYAAFDPLFWLHHVNIDRIFAFWQTMFPEAPESYVVPEPNNNGTIATAAGTVEDIDSPLMPFALDSSGTLHTARTVRYTKNLGYAYAELQHSDLTSTELAARTSQTVEDLYGDRNLWGD